MCFFSQPGRLKVMERIHTISPVPSTGIHTQKNTHVMHGREVKRQQKTDERTDREAHASNHIYHHRPQFAAHWSSSHGPTAYS